MKSSRRRRKPDAFGEIVRRLVSVKSNNVRVVDLNLFGRVEFFRVRIIAFPNAGSQRLYGIYRPRSVECHRKKFINRFDFIRRVLFGVIVAVAVVRFVSAVPRIDARDKVSRRLIKQIRIIFSLPGTALANSPTARYYSIKRNLIKK